MNVFQALGYAFIPLMVAVAGLLMRIERRLATLEADMKWLKGCYARDCDEEGR